MTERVAELLAAIRRKAAADGAWDAFKAERNIREGYCYIFINDDEGSRRWDRLERETYDADAAVRQATTRLAEAERQQLRVGA